MIQIYVRKMLKRALKMDSCDRLELITTPLKKYKTLIFNILDNF